MSKFVCYYYFLPVLAGLFLLQNSLSAQTKKSDTPKWANKGVRDQLYPRDTYFVSFLLEEELKPKFINPEKEDQLLLRLKQKVSSNIYTAVKQKSTYSVSESSNNGFSENYDSYTEIESTINISGCFDYTIEYVRKNKTLYGIIKVNKRQLGESYIQYFENDYALLVGQMERYSIDNSKSNDITGDLNRFRSRKNILNYYITIISISGVKIPERFNVNLSKMEEILSDIESSLDKSSMEESIKQAEVYFEQLEYAKALAMYEVVNIKMPNDPRVTNGITESKLKLEQQYVNNANNYKISRDFDLAVLEYDKLFLKVPEVKYKYQKEYDQLEQVAFDHFAKELDYALEYMTLREAQEALEKLNKYQFVNQKKYDKYYQKVENLNADKLYDKAEIEYYQGHYSSSITTIKKAQKYSRDIKFIRLKNKSITGLYKIELEEYKLTQPHLFALQVGGGYQTQNSLWSTTQKTDTYNINWIPSASIGFFITHGKHNRIKSSSKDKSRKNLLGLRYTYVFQEKKTSFNNLNELELVVGFARYFLFNVGVSTFYIDANLKNTKIESFSSSLALRWYMHPLEMQFEFKTYMDSEANFYPLAKITLVIHAKMKRKVNKRDKERIRTKVFEEYN